MNRGLAGRWRSLRGCRLVRLRRASLALGATLIVFWLVLQFNRSVRALRNVSDRPLGHVDSAVMLNAKLQPGLQMLQVLALTKSLGRQTDANGDVFVWADDGGAEVVVTLPAAARRAGSAPAG